MSHEFSDPDITTAIVKLRSGNLFVSSVYLDILREGSDMFLDKLLQLIHHCKQSNSQLILGIDSNAHSFLWGPDSNPRGEMLEELMATNVLELANIGFEPTFVAQGTQTNIDITLQLNTSVINWKVTDEVSMFDHRPIRFSITTTNTTKLRSPI